MYKTSSFIFKEKRMTKHNIFLFKNKIFIYIIRKVLKNYFIKNKQNEKKNSNCRGI